MRTFPGDTLRVIGEHFGSGTAMDVVLFTTTSRAEAAAEIISWSDTEIVVIIPDNATDGPIRVSLANGDAESAGRLFVVAPEISYDDDVFPLLTTYGCTSCHGGINNLEVFPYAALLRGDSDNGPVVLPRRSADSVIRRKISPQPPFGERMPQGGPYLSEAEQLLIADWIDQGARDN